MGDVACHRNTIKSVNCGWPKAHDLVLPPIPKAIFSEGHHYVQTYQGFQDPPLSLIENIVSQLIRQLISLHVSFPFHKKLLLNLSICLITPTGNFKASMQCRGIAERTALTRVTLPP